MYEEDMVFGPLTARQALIVLVGGGAALLVWQRMPEYGLAPAVLLTLITLALVVRFKPKRIEDVERYFRENPKGRTRLEKKIAEVSMMLHERKARGLGDDPQLDAALENLTKLKQEIERTSGDTNSRGE